MTPTRCWKELRSKEHAAWKKANIVEDIGTTKGRRKCRVRFLDNLKFSNWFGSITGKYGNERFGGTMDKIKEGRIPQSLSKNVGIAQMMIS